MIYVLLFFWNIKSYAVYASELLAVGKEAYV